MMPRKPAQASEYSNEQAKLVRATCLYVATKLGDLMDELVIVGGLVPSLIIDQHELPVGADAHVGTMDLDVGLDLAILDKSKYKEIARRLRDAGFSMDVNESGNPTRQRWVIDGAGRVTVDFLISPENAEAKPGTLFNLERDFAALRAPGVAVAFRDRVKVTLDGITLFNERATRDVWVCGAGAFVVMKALAFASRGENKDAYDLYYVVRNYGAGPHDVAELLLLLLDDPASQEAVKILRRDFSELDSIGPSRVAQFVMRAVDEDLQADVRGGTVSSFVLGALVVMRLGTCLGR